MEHERRVTSGLRDDMIAAARVVGGPLGPFGEIADVEAFAARCVTRWQHEAATFVDLAAQVGAEEQVDPREGADRALHDGMWSLMLHFGELFPAALGKALRLGLAPRSPPLVICALEDVDASWVPPLLLDRIDWDGTTPEARDAVIDVLIARRAPDGREALAELLSRALSEPERARILHALSSQGARDAAS